MGFSQKMNILLVEDDFLLAMSEKSQLEQYGYAVSTVNSGEKAVDAVKIKPEIDLILMDINLGLGMDGTQAAQIILTDHDIPIVFLSSHIEPLIVEMTEKITSYGYVVKNSSITVLDASIKMAFKLFDSKIILLASNQKYEEAQRISQIGSWGHNPVNDTIWGDNAGKGIYGLDLAKDVFTSAEVMNCVIEKLYVKKAMKDLLTENKPYNIKFRIITNNSGKEKTIRSIAKIGKDGIVVGVLRDITSEETIEKELASSNSILSVALQHAPIGFSISDANQTLVTYNKRLFEILQMTEDGYANKQYSNRQYIRIDGSLIPSNEFPSCRAILENRVIEPVEIGVVKEDGAIIWVNVSAAPLGDGHCVVLTNDITERIIRAKKEERLRPLTVLLSSSVLDAIVMLDENFFVLFWNLSAQKMFGYSEKDVMGKSLHEMMVPAKFTERYALAHEHYKLTGEGNAINRTMDAEVVHKDGHVVHVEMSLSAYQYNDKWCSTAILRDVTERKAIEQKLKDTLAEKELLLKEVHHRIKNNMNTISSLLFLQAQTIKEPLIIDAFEEAGNRIQCISLLYDKLYRSPICTELSTKDYLAALIDEIVANFPNSKLVKVEKDIQDFKLDAKRLQPIGIIINELITNIMKYAFKGKDSGLITLSAANNKGHITISVQDDGSGILESVSFENSIGFGLQLINALTEQLKGTIRIERGNGTRVVLEFEQID